MSVATLSRIENGKQTVDAALLVVLAKIIGVPPSVLLGGVEPSLNTETVIATLALMADDERRRVVRAAVERRIRKARAPELVEEVVADLDVVAEKLIVVKCTLRKNGRRN